MCNRNFDTLKANCHGAAAVLKNENVYPSQASSVTAKCINITSKLLRCYQAS
jgi:hypothetical protein